jgi:predicted transposase/invertase (TIGR01784 family)
MTNHAGKPHDAIFKKFLAHPDTAREFLGIHLPPALRAVCDLTTLSLKPDSFVEPGLRAAYTDILYSLHTTLGDGYIYCLIEHQSTPDPMMAFRMMQYCLRIMRAHLDNIKEENSRKLPIVIPLLFYQGKTAYPYSVDWFDCFADPETARTLYSNAFPLIDLAAIPDDEIMKHGRVALLELVQKHIRQRDIMTFLDHFVKLLSMNTLTPDQREAFLHYVIPIPD